MRKISVQPDEEFSAQFPALVPIRVKAMTRDGETHLIDMVNPKGHDLNPMGVNDVSEKFTSLAVPVLGEARASEALAALWAIDRAASLTTSFDLLDPV
jgi:2-methylcitrate dehydratase